MGAPVSRTPKPCDFGHVLGYRAPAPAPEPDSPAREPGDWTDDEIAHFAGLDFEPWDKSDCPLPSNQEWCDGVNPYLGSMRLAFAALCMTKADLIVAVRGLEAEGLYRPLMDDIAATERLMQGYRDLCAAAWARLMCAATNAEMQDGGDR